MIAFSPGVAQGCFELLDIASRNRLTFPKFISSFTHIGNQPTARVIDTARALNWLRAGDDDVATLTPLGLRILERADYEPRLRQALLDYIDVERPPWVKNAMSGRARVLAFANQEVAQVFVEAGVTHGIEDTVVAFWDSMAIRARGQKEDSLLAIGRRGERLTLAYEEARTGRKPKWVALESNEDGYDVLSVVNRNDTRLLSIEVKASSAGINGAFHLTRHEWDRAQESELHCFHLWDIRANTEPTVAIVTSKDIQPHIPLDSGVGAWEVIEVPFSPFQ